MVSPEIRIAIGAQAFGFGPVSKAASIARALIAANPRVAPVFCADGVCREYLEREGLWRPERDIDLGSVALDALSEAVGRIDAAIVVLDPELASRLGRPCYFVDSLGFMWGGGFFDAYPAVRNATRYFVQDAFGAAARLEALGVRHVHPVGGIVDAAMARADRAPDTVIGLGGLLNIFSAAPVRDYAEGVLHLLGALALPDDTLVLTSRSAREAFAGLSAARFAVDAAPHAAALWMVAHARAVFVSPGLTTLLELTAHRIAFVPLPPQNMSQALIVYHVSLLGAAVPEIWRFLARHYPIAPGIDEDEGVRLVQRRNAELLRDPGFAAGYAALAGDPRPLPPSLVPDMDGAAAIAAAVLSDLGR